MNDYDTAAVSLFPLRKNLTKQNIGELKHQFKLHVTNHNNSAVVFDMKQVERIDAAGLRLLITFQQSLTDSGQRMILASVKLGLRQLLFASKLNRLFTIAKDYSNASQLI